MSDRLSFSQRPASWPDSLRVARARDRGTSDSIVEYETSVEIAGSEIRAVISEGLLLVIAGAETQVSEANGELSAEGLLDSVLPSRTLVEGG